MRKPKSVADDILTRMFIRDLTVGIGDSGIRAQSIKVATDRPGFTPNNVRIPRRPVRHPGRRRQHGGHRPGQGGRA
jgi:hypothetical protein